MLALQFRVGKTAYAIPAMSIVEVLPLCKLRELAHVPPEVVGLLAFRGFLVPVVDVNRLLGAELEWVRSSTRIVVVNIREADQTRQIGLLADAVTDLIRSNVSKPGVDVAQAKYLGEHLVDQEELPQLILPEQILPEPLRALFRVDLESPANQVD
jgi:chemotaxis-related protein WspB